MPPKQAKKGSEKSSAKPAVNKNWEAGLVKAQLEEDSWRACVSFVVGRSPEDEELIQALAQAAQTPLRRLFSLLTLDSTLAKIQELGNPKSKKPDDVPMFYEVTEPAKVLLDAGQEIPCDLMAKILKFQLLQIKTCDQQRRDREQLSKPEEEKAKAAPPSAKDKGGAKAAPPSAKDKGGAKASKKGGSAPTPLEPTIEKKTQLKRRDDVESPTFIDDEPEDGPQHYILVLGFHQPHLIKELDFINVHIANVIKLCSDHAQTSEELQEKDTCDRQEESMRLDPEAESIKATEARKFDLFWSSLRPVLDRGPPESRLHDVVQLSYTVQDWVPPFSKEDPEAKLEMGSQIFEGVANLIYDSLDWRRQHQHYVDNVKLISVPTVNGLDPQPVEKSKREGHSVQGTEQPLLSSDVDMRYYNDLLHLVPPEACSVPLILHSMLEQVVISEEPSTPSPANKEPKPNNSPALDPVLLSFMLESFLPLLQTKEEKSRLLNKVLSKAQNEEDREKLLKMFGTETPPNKSEQPQIIRQHDETALRFRDINGLKGFDPVEVESSMMRLSPVCELIHSVAQQSNTNSCWMAIKQQLQHHCTDDIVSWPEVERLFQLSVFESMPLNKPDQKGLLLTAAGPMGSGEQAPQHKEGIIPWDNPPSYGKQKLKDRRTKGLTFLTEDPSDAEISGRVSCQLDLSDIQTCRLRSLCDWHYAEHHSASIFLQVLHLASEEYRCLDTFRGSLKNVLYIFCHNPVSPNFQCNEFWDVALHTDVKFRKYLEHVAKTISDWTKEEELKREEISCRSRSPVKSPEVKGQDEKVEGEEDTLNPFIRKDSLKAWKLEQEQLKEEETSKKSKKDNSLKSKQQKDEAKPTDDKKSKALTSGKKGRAETANSSNKTSREPVTATAPSVGGNKEQHPPEEVLNVFTGYSMDGKLIHVSGCLQSLFPTDGGRITVENISYVEGSSLMKVAVNKDGHNFFTHINHVVVDQVKPQFQPQNQESNVKDIKESEPVEKKRVKQGSFSAVLNNGIRLSYSYYGPTGEHRVSTLESETSTFPPHPLSPSPQHSESMVCEGQPALTSTPFNSLNISLPNGLVLQFLKEDSKGVSEEEQGILVKQGFPLHGRGVAGQLQDSSLCKEYSRIITSQGAVIRYMRDGSTQVLFADGTVSVGQDSGPVWVPDSDLVEENNPQEVEDTMTSQTKKTEKEADSQRGFWLTTTPSGTRIHTVGTTHQHIPTTPLLVFKSTDPITHEVMLNREDLVISVQSPEGSRCADHADGTRITSIYQDRPPNTLHHLHLHPGEQRGSVTLRPSSDFACGCIECVCDTPCTATVNEKIQSQDMNEEETIGCAGKESSGQAECEHRCSEMEGRAYKDGEESMSAGENGPKNSCDREKGSLATKEQLVLVEKEGCATVVMYPERHMAHVFLADGTVITGNNRGAYQVFPSKVGLLQIQADGVCVYTSDPPVTPSPNGGTLTNQPGSYTMSHIDKVACDVTDMDGNHFQVMEDGQLSVLNFSPDPSTMTQNEGEPEEEEEREMARREHCPRLFVVHEDGSGTELLSSQTVEDLLYQAYSDPTIAVLKEPLPDTQDEFGITILKPSQQSVWSQWLLRKQNPDITPPNLRNRTWHDFPRTEVRVPGPSFGTNLGKGLTLRETWHGSAEQHQPIRDCPKVLEIRELYQHRPITASLKNTVDTRLREYIESVMEKEQRSEDMKIKDPRTKEEVVHASDLLNLVLSFAEDEEARQSLEERTSEDIANLYSQAVEAPAELDISEDSATLSSDSFTSEKESKWAGRLAQHRQEISEETACREALRKKNIVPYFHPENNSLHQELLISTLTHQRPDMRTLSMALPPIPRSESAEADLKDAPQENTPRPLNPTPSKSASHAAASGRMVKKGQANSEHHTGQSSPRESSRQMKAVQMDVTGKPRKTKVRLPTSILSSKPSSVPNQQFLSVEEPVRKKCKTVSLMNPDVIVRGFQLLPSRVDFGTLQEGTSATITVVMKNVGVDTCRFHVKQPPPATGLRVIYNHGPVAAGLHVELQVQLFAMCAVQAGEEELKKCITYDIVINTEVDILYLPVTAHILPGRLYNAWLKDHNKKGFKGLQESSSKSAGRGSSSVLTKPPVSKGHH
ncbi:sperm-associated antigen 17 [Halichoeres trimaculatus]|uniref:sperm-associated antigen 17 n=1 Tax=Halichoeres trimaculatus TaxID=147232 RepID=UPI003D9EB170